MSAEFVFLVWPPAEGVDASDSSNLTQILESWRSSIMAEVKDLLLQHHNTVLADYSR